MPRVAEVLIGRGDGFVTEVTGEVMLQFGGFAGDRHFGLTRASDSRTPWHPRGTVIGNTRQISIVSIEVCAAAHDVGIARIYPSWLGANLAFKNVADLSAMPPSTRILFPSGATLFVTEENVPCRQPAKVIAHEYGHPEQASTFVKTAIRRRGILALVEREGLVKTDDRLKLISHGRGLLPIAEGRGAGRRSTALAPRPFRDRGDSPPPIRHELAGAGTYKRQKGQGGEQFRDAMHRRCPDCGEERHAWGSATHPQRGGRYTDGLRRRHHGGPASD